MVFINLCIMYCVNLMGVADQVYNKKKERHPLVWVALAYSLLGVVISVIAAIMEVTGNSCS